MIQRHLVVSVGPVARVPALISSEQSCSASGHVYLLPQGRLDALSHCWPYSDPRLSAASTYWLPASLLHSGFPRAADIVGSGMKSWPHPSLTVCPCPSYLTSVSPEAPQYFTCKYNVYFIQSHLQTKLKVKFISATLLSHLNKGLFSAFSPCCAGLLMAF